MGFRFRKSFGKGPFRINISKSGIGYSIGVKGARITKTAKGTKRTTLSVPGTGLSYVSETSGKRKRKRNRKPSSSTTPVSVPKSDNHTNTNLNTNMKGTFSLMLKVIKKILLYIFATIVFLFVAFILIGATLGITSKTEVDKNAPLTTATATLAPTATLETTDTPAPSAPPTEAPKATPKPAVVPTAKPTTKPMAKSTTATVVPTATPKPTVAPTEVPTVAPTATAKPTEAPTSTPVPQSNDTVSQHWVWVSANGTKYHSNSNCSNMKNPKKVTYDEAIELGYEPCKKCN